MQIIQSSLNDEFRDKVRAWLHSNVPKEQRPKRGRAMREFDTQWQRTQFEAGWAGLAWPREYGGQGFSLIQQMIWMQEYALAGAPAGGAMFVATTHAGPTLITHGTEAQKAFHLPKILSGESVWCQGFSEPGAGSDLAGLSTKAQIDGEYLVINGSKIWTSYAKVADYQELLVRTDPQSSRHKGISWVICDMHAPGISVRPIMSMSGLDTFCEVFYDDVRIPLDRVVGELNNGWRIAMTTLGFERGTATIAHQIELSRTVDALLEIAKKADSSGTGETPIDDTSVAAELAVLRAEVATLRSMTSLTISRNLHQDVPGPEGAIVALFFCELARRVYAMAITLLGPIGLERDTNGRDWPLEYLEAYKWAIGGGTSEIRRNLIAERVLGLPK
ncbi:MAG: acyl-CoA dehydrogenase [Halieaceae bacterium]|jgi:alkylation response protein AidB-like acyl-CoA dehydrogenase|nr:acyl-CoA dehydrogenase [Halieaceae bacterium]